MGVNHLSKSRPLLSVIGFLHTVDVCYCVLKKLELSSEYFGRYCKKCLSLKQLKTYSWKLKTVYCKLKMHSWKLKMVYWKLHTIEHELRSTGPNLVPLLAIRCLYQGIGYILKLKTVYCKLKTYSWKLKRVYWKLQTIENEIRSTGPNLLPLVATKCLYPGYIWA